jgi:hypothetical protein
MAEELRIIKGDSHEIIVTVKDSDGSPINIIQDLWNVEIETDISINKNSIDNPTDFNIVDNIVTIYLTAYETGIVSGCPRKHFKIKLYKDDTVKTVSTGDLIFVDEV